MDLSAVPTASGDGGICEFRLTGESATIHRVLLVERKRATSSDLGYNSVRPNAPPAPDLVAMRDVTRIPPANERGDTQATQHRPRKWAIGRKPGAS